MGKLGRWIDGLEDEQKDNILREQNWNPYGAIRGDGARCLVTAALQVTPEEICVGEPNLGTSIAAPGKWYGPLDRSWFWDHQPIGRRYSNLCQRFGLNRIVRACKLRAAKGNDKIEVEIDLNEMSRADAEPQKQEASNELGVAQ